MMKWNIQGIEEKLKNGVNSFLNYWNIASDLEGILIIVEAGDCLSIKSNDNGYRITYQDYAGIFRGLAILRGCLENNETDIDICEYKKFDTCGVLIDCSRNAVLTVEKMKEVFLKLACVGINSCMLYTEDTYEMKEYPYFGYMRGAYTPSELKELDACALSFGIELIPCIQTLGHLRQALRWPFAENIKDTDAVLLIGSDETYQFIDNMFKTFSECLSSKNIHIGMDEAYGVGVGRYLNINGFKDRTSLFIEHLQKVVKIAEKYGYKPMMWGDMFFRLCASDEDYYNGDATLSSEIKEQLSLNLGLVHWDYYHDDEETYDSMVKKYKSVSDNIFFAGGIWKWAGTSICYDKTFKTTYPALNSMQKNGIKNVFATIWGDDGGEVLFDSVWLGIQLYGEYNYHSTVSDEHLRVRFKQCLGYEPNQFTALQIDDYPKEWCHNDECLELSKAILYQDVLCGLFDKNIENIPVKEHYQKHLDTIKGLDCPKGLEKLYAYQKKLLEVLILKCNIGLEISKAYKANDTTMLEICVVQLNELQKSIFELQAIYGEAWKNENKIFGLDRIDLRLGGLIGRINSAAIRINEYLSGKCNYLEELEVEKLMYGGEKVVAGKSLFATHIYDSLVSASSNGVN